jgi:hypothetical protein
MEANQTNKPMAKKQTTKAAAKKKAPVKTAASIKTVAAQQMPVQGDSVNYVLTKDEKAQFVSHADIITGSVVRVNGAEVVIKCTPQPGVPWQKGVFHDHKKTPGTYHLPE